MTRNAKIENVKKKNRSTIVMLFLKMFIVYCISASVIILVTVLYICYFIYIYFSHFDTESISLKHLSYRLYSACICVDVYMNLPGCVFVTLYLI